MKRLNTDKLDITVRMEDKSGTMAMLLTLYAIPMAVMICYMPLILSNLYFANRYTFDISYIVAMLNLLGVLVFVGLPIMIVIYGGQACGVIKECPT
jgi:hypothetical protein